MDHISSVLIAIALAATAYLAMAAWQATSDEPAAGILVSGTSAAWTQQ